MLDYVSVIQPNTPIDFCAKNRDVIDVLLFRANKLAKTHRLTIDVVSSGLRAAASWCGGDQSRLADRTWLIHAGLSDVSPFNRKLMFTVAELRFAGGSFKFVRAGRVNMRANRMPPVSYILDVHSDVRPFFFTPIAPMPRV